MKFGELIQRAANGCEQPGCAHAHAQPMYLHANCHPSAATFAVVDGGKLRIECAQCKKVVVEIEP